MSKKPTHVNVSRAVRVLPDGTAIPVGGGANLAAADKKHPVVAAWIAAGILVAANSKAAREPDPDTDATKGLAAITAERDAAQAERDTAKADLAMAGEAWQALRASLEAAEDTDDAKAIEERIAAMDKALPAPS